MIAGRRPSCFRFGGRKRHSFRRLRGEEPRHRSGAAGDQNRDEGSTLGFSKSQARKLLDLPSEETIAGLRDRAILSVGLQVGLRRAEIAALAGVKFATDSALEGAGFEPSVPLAKEGRGH